MKLENVLRLGCPIDTMGSVSLHDRMVRGLNSLGSDGWQLAVMLPNVDCMIFQREVAETAAQTADISDDPSSQL